MTDMADTVFLFDVDNTLLDNDRVQADLDAHLALTYGEPVRDRYWVIFEELRASLGYTDYLGTLERYRLEAMHDPRVLRMACWLLEYPFADRVYQGAIDAVRRAQAVGVTSILSDGDAVFQPRKVERSGLWSVFGDNVLIYVHKEQELADVEVQLPARHYVLIDDKLDPGCRQARLGRPGDDSVSAPGPLRDGPEDPGRLPAGRRHDRAHRRLLTAQPGGPGQALGSRAVGPDRGSISGGQP